MLFLQELASPQEKILGGGQRHCTSSGTTRVGSKLELTRVSLALSLLLSASSSKASASRSKLELTEVSDQLV
jgi:hypothetical protein